MKWECSMTVKGKSVYVGVYKTEKQAAMAYDEKIKELYGESALLNFPNT